MSLALAPLQQVLPALPMLCLQAMAIIGVLSIVSSLSDRVGWRGGGADIRLGLALGFAAYGGIWFATAGTSGLPLADFSAEILLLAGMLAGWRGAATTMALTLAARLLHAGSDHVLLAALDDAMHMLVGVLLGRQLLAARDSFSVPRTAFLAWLAGMAACAIGLFFALFVFGVAGNSLAAMAWQRALAQPAFLFVLLAAFLLLRAEARRVSGESSRVPLRQQPLALAGMPDTGEKHFSEIFEHAPVALLFADRQGRILGSNRSFMQLLGYAREDLPNLTQWWQLVCPDPSRRSLATARWSVALARAMTDGGEIAAESYEVSCKDGSVRSVVIAGNFIGETLLCSFEDITAQARAQTALVETEDRLRNLFERVEHISVQAYDEDRRVIYWNKASEVLYGYPAAEAIGQRLEDLIIPAPMRALVVAAVQAWLDEGIPIPAGELTLQRKDGSQVPVFSSHVMMQTRRGREMYCVDVDLSEVKRAHSGLQLAASVFTHSREGIVITSPEGRIIDFNARFCEIYGYDRETLIGKIASEILLSEVHGPAFKAAMRQELADSGKWSGEIWNRHRDGDLYASMLNINAVRGADGRVTHYVVLASDITSQREQERQLAHAANYDALTSLPNRKLLTEKLNDAITRANRAGQVLAVIFLDLDGFKAINDRHGQDVGNQLLMAVGLRVRASLRGQDLLARLGGDEFVAVVEGLESEAACASLLESILTAVSVPTLVEAQEFTLTASLGVTFLAYAECDADQLLRQADQAMYQAKLAGKNRYALFDAERDRDLRGSNEIREALRLGLQRGEFVLHYQPKANLRSGEVIGCEALIRWQHPERGLLPPSAFLPMLGESQLAVELDEWVINAALTQISAWAEAGVRMSVSVNVGASQLLKPGFEQRLASMLRAHPGVNPRQLEVEVLESSALTDLARAGQVIRVCREMGVGFAIDDFGTGYSSLTYLKHLPVGVLKIDQSFVREMLADRDSIAILEGIIDLAAAFDRAVIAEGVETDEHARMLLRLGCIHAQGYGIARPMPAAAIPAWLASWRPDPAWAGIRRVRREDLPVLHAIVEQRAWLVELEEHLRRNTPLGPAPLLDWMEMPAWELQTTAREIEGQMHALARSLLSLRAAKRSAEALVRLPELNALRDRLADELLGLMHRSGAAYLDAALAA